jgi:hypothetical protein
MLVSEERARKWYKRNSWVHRNFEYLFKNPLWTKEPPAGFSICPYFWLSLFSLLVFRPFTVALSRVIGPLFLATVGRPFVSVDKWLLLQLRRLIIGRRADDMEQNDTPGFGVVVMIYFFVLFVLLNFGFFALCRWYIHDVVQEPLFIVEFWAVAGGIIIAIASLIHAAIRSRKNLPRCRTEAYLYVWAILVVAALLIFAPGQCKNLAIDFCIGTWAILKDIGFGISVGAKWFGHALWVTLLFLGHYLWIAFKFAPGHWPIPWWVYIGGAIAFMASYGWIADRWLQWIEQRMDARELRARNRQRWVDVLSELMWKEYWVNQIIGDGNVDRSKALKTVAPLVLRRACELQWKDQLDVLQEYAPYYPASVFKQIKAIDGAQSRIKAAWKNLPYDAIKNKLSDWTFDEERMKANIYTAQRDAQFRQQIEAATIRYAALRRKCEEKMKRATESPMHKACVEFTTGILDAARMVGRGIATGAKGVGYAIVWSIKQLAIFVSFMWMLIKAKKHKVCPYFRFED